ncbi:MAG TPA: LysR family transcriptional regulator, partial [Flavobacteriaceae bacterium]|nr:LysR family transcriptional regulator [Flavobacteriaceae bacterium]
MDFRLLVFKNVADHLSFTKASKALFISQPAVTRHINELEKQYEKALFNRLGNKISLTDEGELFLNYTNRILELYQELETNFQHFNKVFPKKIAMG